MQRPRVFFADATTSSRSQCAKRQKEFVQKCGKKCGDDRVLRTAWSPESAPGVGPPAQSSSCAARAPLPASPPDALSGPQPPPCTTRHVPPSPRPPQSTGFPSVIRRTRVRSDFPLLTTSPSPPSEPAPVADIRCQRRTREARVALAARGCACTCRVDVFSPGRYEFTVRDC